MTFRNKSLDIGDLVETVWTDDFGEPLMMGIIIDFSKAWKDRKVNVYWDKIGFRLEWLNDIRRLKTE